MTNATGKKTKEVTKRGPNRSAQIIFEEKVADLEKKIAFHADLEKSLKAQLKSALAGKAARDKTEKDSAAGKIAVMRAEITRLESL